MPDVRIWAEVKEGNEASLAFAKKLGFEEKACLSDRECGIILTD
jgi:RimJ/RimL family protein N-acetyltransferase